MSDAVPPDAGTDGVARGKWRGMYGGESGPLPDMKFDIVHVMGYNDECHGHVLSRTWMILRVAETMEWRERG